MLFLAMVLVVALAGCETPWRMGRFDTRGTGFNPAEWAIDRDNVASLGVVATADVPQAVEPFLQPIVSHGSVYLSGLHELVVYSAYGSIGCSGLPRSCQPLWTAPIGDFWIDSVPTVSDGQVFVVSRSSVALEGTLHVFDAAGVRGCSGTPKVCEALWTAPVGGHSAPTVKDHHVFVIDRNDIIAALDADGVEGCAGSPKVCQPLWTTAWRSRLPNQQFEAPTVGAGVLVVVANYGDVTAYDANGSTNCAGLPKVCQPLWKAHADSPDASTAANYHGWTAPVVIGDRVITYWPGPYGTISIKAFDVQGIVGCGGAPVVCTPRWSTTVTGVAVDAEVTAAYGSIFVMSEDLNAPHGRRLTALADDGAGCTGTPMQCPVQWEHLFPVDVTFSLFTSPLVANGLLYVPTIQGLSVFDAHPLRPARDWTASPGECSATTGHPLSCQPIATITGPAAERTASISDGRLYVLETLPAGGLPLSSMLKIYAL